MICGHFIFIGGDFVDFRGGILRPMSTPVAALAGTIVEAIEIVVGVDVQ